MPIAARLLVGQGFQNAPGRGLGGENPLDGVDGVSIEADGAFQGGEQVVACVGAQQRQHAAGLALAIALVAQQAVEEAAGDGAQLAEAFTQQRLLFL